MLQKRPSRLVFSDDEPEIFEYLRANEPNTRVVRFAMNEKVIYDVYKNPYVFVASDGKLTKNMETRHTEYK